MTPNTYQIEIKKLQIYAKHGVFKEERTLGQMFEVDLTLDVSQTKEINDDQINGLVSYAEIIKHLEQIILNNNFKLLEKLALTILESLSSWNQIIKSKLNSTVA